MAHKRGMSEIVHLTGKGSTLIGFTSISRKKNPDKPESFTIRSTEYEFRLFVEHTKELTSKQIEDLKPLLRLAWNQAAIESSNWLIDDSTKEKDIHDQLGSEIKPMMKDGMQVGFEGGKLALTFSELYTKKERVAATPEKQVDSGWNKMEDEAAKRALLEKMAASMGLTLK